MLKQICFRNFNDFLFISHSVLCNVQCTDSTEKVSNCNLSLWEIVKNKIEDTPILKLAMVKRLYVNKNLPKNLSKNFVKKSSKKILKKIVKKIVKKNRQKKLSKKFVKKFVRKFVKKICHKKSS